MNLPSFIYKACLLFLLTAFNTNISAQLFVQKDHLACAYGLKNSQGNWVVPATYVHIEKTSCANFIVYDGLNHGVLDLEGKLLIPVIYSYISEHRIQNSKERSDPFDSEYFTQKHEIKFLFFAQKQEKWGVINDQGKLIIPHEYDRIQMDGDHLMLQKLSEAQKYSSYADKTGKILFYDLPGYVYPFAENPWALFGEKEYRYDDEDLKYGLIDTLGKVIAAMIYYDIDFCNDRFTVQNQGKTGVIDIAGNILLKPEYYIVIHGDPKCINPNETYLVVDPVTHKYGFMKGDYSITTAPVYDKAMWIEKEKKTSKSSYTVELQQQMGVADENGKITIEPYYSNLIPLTYNLPLIPGRNKSGKEKKLKQKFIRKNYFISRKEGKYGLITEDGQTIFEPEFEYHEWGNTTIFSKGIKLFILEYSNENPQLVEAPLIFSNDSLYLFSVKEDLLPLYTTKKSPETLTKFLHLAYRQSGFYCIKLLDKRKTVLYSATGKKLDLDNINRFYTEDESYMVFSCGEKETKMGMLHMQTGKLLLDTIYSSIQVFSPVNQIWAGQMDNTGQKVKYILFDTLGKRRTDIFFDWVPISINSTMIVSTNDRLGILGKDLQWLAPPIYKEIRKLDSRNFHIVITQNMRIGLLDPEYNLVADTVYTDFTPVFSKLKNPDGRPGWWMLESDSKRLLFNSNCVLIDETKNAQIDSMLLDFAFKGADHDLSFKIRVEEPKSHLLALVPFRKEMYEVLRKSYDRQRKYYSAQYLNMGELVMPFTTDKQHASNSLVAFGLVDLGLNYMSVYESNVEIEGGNFYAHHQPVFSNYIWQNGMLRKISIRDIFGTGKFLENELISRLPIYGDLNLKCSTPELMVQEIGEKFSLSERAIILYLLSADHRYVEIRIPVSQLQYHEESAWIVEYLTSKR